MFESTEDTIIREMKEELDIDITINRLLWVSEHFFNHEKNRYHEICFYYLIECNDEKLLGSSDTFYITEGKNNFEFKWVQINDIQSTVLYPTFIKHRLNDLPVTIEKVIDSDIDCWVKPLSKVIGDFKFILLKDCGHSPWNETYTKDKFYEIIFLELELK